MSKILLITTMYPNNLRPSTPVCHYFAKQWQNMGNQVMVIYFRSMFPRIYTDLARLFPKLAKRYVGNHVELDRNKSVLQEEKDGIPVYSLPIYKYVPHGKYPRRSIQKSLRTIKEILEECAFVPDAIIGHFYNPQLEIIGSLKRDYPKAKTAVVLHELSLKVIKDNYPKDYQSIISGVDAIGFRSVPIKERFVAIYGEPKHYFLCWSGVSSSYLAPLNRDPFTDEPLTRFLYVGQTIKRKHPKETLEGIYSAYGDRDFSLKYVGSHDIAYDETVAYVNEKSLENKVSFIGKIPRDEIIKLYDESECFILISHYEVFGLVYLEAMSRGCITIASKGEGMEGIIHHGVNGFLCEPGNPTELSQIIEEINSLTAEEKNRISNEARKTAEELSDFNVAKSYLDHVMNS